MGVARAAPPGAPAAVTKGYRVVLRADLAVGKPAPCLLHVYFPANRKYLHFLDKGDVLTEAHFQKLREKGLNALYVAVEDLPAFYGAATAQAKTRDKAAKMGLTERRHRLEDGARELIEPLMKGTGPVVPDLAQKLFEVIRRTLLALPSGTIGDLVRATMGQPREGWSRAVNAATFGALFSMAFDLDNPSEVATAALLRDMGEEHAKGTGHVEATLKLLEGRGVELSMGVLRAIRQHHERSDGKGYPEGLGAAGISPGAVALALAERFDDATCAVAGEPMQPDVVLIARFRTLLDKDPGALPVDLIDKVFSLLQK